MDDTTTLEIDESIEPADVSAAPESDELVDEELLVEEVSIDGMCGVY